MWPDVIDIYSFYSSSLGHVAQRSIRRKLRELWPNLSGLNVMGLGYAAPYLRPFRKESQRVLLVMPAQMGVMAWPSDEPNLACLSHEMALALPDLSMDRVLLVHGLEFTHHMREFLREIWRVLADDGRMMVVVPNRRGIWARFDHTPFGHGQPYSTEQIHRMLRDAMFAPIRTERALFVPPSHRQFVVTSAPAWEKIGGRWLQPWSGVVMVEAAKQIYAGAEVQARARARQRRKAVVPAGLRRSGEWSALFSGGRAGK